MKTFIAIVFAGALSLIAVPLQADDKEKTAGEAVSDAWDTTKQKTKEAADAVADTTKKAATAVKEAFTPDSDANKVNVTVTDAAIDLPKSIDAGKTAFVVKNTGKERHNFQVKGEGIDEKFLMGVGPNETKVLHMDLMPGQYKAMVVMTEKEDKNVAVDLTVRRPVSK